jgi:hypothetical protein
MAAADSRSPSEDRINRADDSRREFLKQIAVLPAAMAAGQAVSASAAAPAESSQLPQISLGKYSISRLVCGANPFKGGSHLSVFVNHQMREYYTDEQVLKTLRRCQEVGINCWQSSGTDYELYRRLVDEGCKMHYLSLGGGNGRPAVDELVKAGCIGLAHHGEMTDRLFKTGKLDTINDFLKRVRDSGMLVGVSTHMPDVVDAIESKGWDLDYYMTCIYERHRSAEDLEKLLGQAPIPVGEVYLPKDPPRMFKAIQSTKRTCLAFKILAAGRLSDRKPWVEKAFRETLAAIKPGDGVIVGIYDRYSDQPAENAALVRRYSAKA